MSDKKHLTAPCEDCGAKPGEYCSDDCPQDCKKPKTKPKTYELN